MLLMDTPLGSQPTGMLFGLKQDGDSPMEFEDEEPEEVPVADGATEL